MSAQTEADLALLRRFEPVIRYTRGEQFFPMGVEPYVRECSLWRQRPDEDAECLIPEGELTLERLSAVTPQADSFDAVYFLKFIEPLNIPEMATYALREGLAHKDPRQVFRAGKGRLARVGYGSRFVDALFSLTLLARGRVPGDTAAAAALTYKRILKANPCYSYYGRVVRAGGWVALQYWFFYAFNNWRSGFSGVNDHESDWEMLYLYLSESAAGEVTPEWVAYASHDFSGDDLRRRWDDAEVEKAGEHPVVYAGAGSHASYFRRGEYLAEVELPFLSPLVQLVDKLQDLGRKLPPSVSRRPEANADFNVFRIPFVDYARGDGLSLGPGGDQPWAEPYLLDPSPAWLVKYRGLWGLYAQDPISGENAPAGPVYNRNGTARRSWYDALGWAGLDKVPPPAQVTERLQQRHAEVAERRADIAQLIEAKTYTLNGLGLELEAMRGQPHLKKLHTERAAEAAALSKDIAQLRAGLSADEALLEALDRQQGQWQAGERGPARAHLTRAHHPATDVPFHRFAEIWAALSIGLMLIAFVALVLFARPFLVFGLAALISLVLFIEAGFRRRLPQFITSVTTALALVAALVLLFDFFWELVVFCTLLAGSYIMWENLRELRN